MNEETGIAIMICLTIIVMGVLLYQRQQSSAEQDCLKFGKFQIEDVMYECKEVE